MFITNYGKVHDYMNSQSVQLKYHAFTLFPSDSFFIVLHTKEKSNKITLLKAD